MTIIHLNQDNFEQEITNSKTPAIIDFYADWCGPCKMMAPVFEKLSKNYNGKLKFCKVNTDENQIIASQFDIQGIPALVMIKNNKEVGRTVGFAPEAELKQKIDSLI